MANVLVHVKAAQLEKLGIGVVPGLKPDDDRKPDPWYLIRYPVPTEAAHDQTGELGYFDSSFMEKWVSVTAVPMSLQVLCARLDGSEYIVEGCRGKEKYDPCGCATQTSWAHTEDSFTQSYACRTCDHAGQRGNAYPPDVWTCSNHSLD